MVDSLTLLPPVVGHAVAIPVGGLTRFAYTLQVADHASLYIACSRELGRKPPLYLAVEDPLTLLPPVVGHAVAIPVGGFDSLRLYLAGGIDHAVAIHCM